MIKKPLITLIALALSLSCSCNKKESVSEMPKNITIQGNTLSLNGSGTRQKNVLVVNMKIYTIGLYLKHPSNDAMNIINSDEPAAFRFVYLRNITFNSIRNNYNIGFNEVCESLNINPRKIKKEKDLLLNIYKKGFAYGDVMFLAYNKEDGFQVFKESSPIPLVTIKNINFKKVIWGLWLLNNKEKNLTELRKSLLGL